MTMGGVAVLDRPSTCELRCDMFRDQCYHWATELPFAQMVI